MKRINIRGVVWDSCCGPRPEITIPRVAALLVVNWFCCRRDKMTYGESFNDCWRLLMDRGWPGLLDKWRGKEVALSLINGMCQMGFSFLIQGQLVPTLAYGLRAVLYHENVNGVCQRELHS